MKEFFLRIFNLFLDISAGGKKVKNQGEYEDAEKKKGDGNQFIFIGYGVFLISFPGNGIAIITGHVIF